MADEVAGEVAAAVADDVAALDAVTLGAGSPLVVAEYEQELTAATTTHVVRAPSGTGHRDVTRITSFDCRASRSAEV